MLREELVLGVLCLFLFKIFPPKEELSQINLSELEKPEFDEKNMFSFIDLLALKIKGHRIIEIIFVFKIFTKIHNFVIFLKNFKNF